MIKFKRLHNLHWFLAKSILVLVFVFGLPSLLQAREFTGFKLEYMNAQKINYYGLGLFTSDRRFDAEAEFFVAQKAFVEDTQAQGEKDLYSNSAPSVTPDYRFWFMSFAGYFHFIRTDKMSVYVGSGIMPLLPFAYSYHWMVGMDFFWSEHFRAYYTYKYLYNNAESYSFPKGSAFAIGLKYSFDFMDKF